MKIRQIVIKLIGTVYETLYFCEYNFFGYKMTSLFWKQAQEVAYALKIYL